MLGSLALWEARGERWERVGGGIFYQPRGPGGVESVGPSQPTRRVCGSGKGDGDAVWVVALLGG